MIGYDLQSRHASVVRMIGHALTLRTDVEVWHGLVSVLRVRLTKYERACLAAMALDAAEDEEVSKIVDAQLVSRSAGTPLPPFFDPSAEARWWADMASPAELKAWLTACFLRLPTREQAGFLAAAKRRVSA